MIASVHRVLTIARNTLLEAFRQKVLNILILFGLGILVLSNFFTQFSFEDEIKFLKDLLYAGISITGLLVALLGAAQLIPAEIERRTLYTILSKPVRRFEFVVGKYLGLVFLLTLMVAIMAAVSCGALAWKESVLVAQHTPPTGAPNAKQLEVIQAIRSQIWDPQLIQALILVWAKLCLVAVISVFFSTMATSTVFIVFTTLVTYFIGHMQSVARTAWLHGTEAVAWWKVGLLGLISFLIPDFSLYSIIDEIIAGDTVPWAHTGQLLAYSLIYVVVALGAASLIFSDREL